MTVRPIAKFQEFVDSAAAEPVRSKRIAKKMYVSCLSVSLLVGLVAFSFINIRLVHDRWLLNELPPDYRSAILNLFGRAWVETTPQERYAILNYEGISSEEDLGILVTQAHSESGHSGYFTTRFSDRLWGKVVDSLTPVQTMGGAFLWLVPSLLLYLGKKWWRWLVR